MRQGDLHTARQAITPHLPGDGPASAEGALALYLSAAVARRQGDEATESAALSRVCEPPFSTLLPPRMLTVARRWRDEGPLDDCGLGGVLRQASALTYPQSRAPIEAWLDIGCPSRRAMTQALAALGQMALEHDDYDRADSDAQAAMLAAQGVDDLDWTTRKSLSIVLARARLEMRRRWGAKVAAITLSALFLGAAMLRPWRRTRAGDIRALRMLATQGGFVIVLFIGLYLLGAQHDSGSQPLDAGLLGILAAVVVASSIIPLGWALGLRGRLPPKRLQLVGAAVAALGTGSSLYLFAYWGDYLPAFGL